MPDQPTNCGRSLRHRGTARHRRRALRIMDDLPPPIRRALHEALMDWDPRWVRAELHMRLCAARQPATAEAATVRMIAAGDETELWSHAEQLRATKVVITDNEKSGFDG